MVGSSFLSLGPLGSIKKLVARDWFAWTGDCQDFDEPPPSRASKLLVFRAKLLLFLNSEYHRAVAKEGSPLWGIRMENSGYPSESLLLSSCFDEGSQDAFSLINQHCSGILLRLSILSISALKVIA